MKIYDDYNKYRIHLLPNTKYTESYVFCNLRSTNDYLTKCVNTFTTKINDII